MPHLQIPPSLEPPKSFSAVEVVYQSPSAEGWSVATVVQAGVEAVGIRWGKRARLRRDRSSSPADFILLPPELAAPVLATARQLEADRRTARIRGYEEQAADLEAEAEALEWCEALIGDGFESEEG